MNYAKLRFKFNEVVAVFSLILELALIVTFVFFAGHAARRSRHALEVILKDLGPKIGVQILPKQVDLLVARKHPVIDIKHMPLNNELHVLLTLVQSCSSLQLFSLRLIEIIKLFTLILIVQPHLLITVSDYPLDERHVS